MRHRRLPLAALLLGSLVLAPAVSAGGWALVTVTGAPVEPAAGSEAVFELSVRQHGEMPVSWPDLSVVAIEQTSREEIRAEAVATGPAGVYTATLVFPQAGSWRLSFESLDLLMDGAMLLDVAPSPVVVAAPPAAAEAVPGAVVPETTGGASTASGSDLLGAIAIGLLLGTLLLVVGLARHEQRVQGGALTSLAHGPKRGSARR
jgi:hypothetical protein